jgi:hypothetical protein
LKDILWLADTYENLQSDFGVVGIIAYVTMLAPVLAIANSSIAVLARQKRINLIHHTALFFHFDAASLLDCRSLNCMLFAGLERRDQCLKMAIVGV